MELRQLRHFLALVDHRHFGRAADSLDISQQALSYSIAQLERALNARLFERSQNATTLTHVGQALERRARIICAEASLASREVNALSTGTEGEIHLGVCPAVGARLLPDIVERFSHFRPGIILNCSVDHSTRLYDRLMAGETEFVVAAPSIQVSTYPELEHEPIPGASVDSNFLSMRRGHPLLRLERPTLADAAKYPWLMPATLPEFTGEVFGAFSRAGVAPPKYIVRIDSFLCTFAIIMRTDFVVLTGRQTVAAELDAGMISGVMLPDLVAKRPVFMSLRKRSPRRSAADALLGLFRSMLATTAPRDERPLRKRLA